ESAAVVVKVNSGHARDEPVGEPGRNLATERIMPVLAPAAYNVVPLLQLVQQVLDVDGVVLQIAVHEDQDLPLTVLDSGLQSCCLAEVAPEANNADARIAIHDLLKQRARSIVAAVVHIDDFVRTSYTLQGGLELPMKDGYALLFVIDRNHDRDFRRMVVEVDVRGGPVRAVNCRCHALNCSASQSNSSLRTALSAHRGM